MEPSSPYRPHVSRETRLLLTAGLVAVAALWLLARIRFQDRPATPNPVPAVLSQLSSPPAFDDLASEIARLQARLQPALIASDLPGDSAGTRAPRQIAALRLREDLAIALLPSGAIRQTWTDANIRASDPASGLAVMRVPRQMTASLPVAWVPRRLQGPRYFATTDVSPQGVSLRPTFVGTLDPVDSPLWSEPLWAVPPGSDLASGSFVFTSNAELVGLVLAMETGLVIVPSRVVLEEAERLVQSPSRVPGRAGLEVQTLSESLAALTGSSIGVVVTWIERNGTAAESLMVGDVIEAIDGRPLASRQHWDVRMARLSAGDTLTLLVRRRGEARNVALVATASVSAGRPASGVLGLALRARPGLGVEVVRVDRASAADRAGLAVGDVITQFAEAPAPSPAQVARAFAAIPEGQRVMVSFSRRDAHLVTALER
jgi:PDZ domain